jgi:hypothetical protein
VTEYVNQVTGEVHPLTDVQGIAAALLAEQALTSRLTVRLDRVLDELREARDSTSVPTDFPDDDDWAPWNWRCMTAPEAQVALSALMEWVHWLRHRYPVAHTLPACWHRHPELIEELSALQWAWRAAFHGDEARPSAPADFHGHYLLGVLDRVRRWGVHCGDTHEPRAEGVYGPPPRRSTASLDARTGATESGQHPASEDSEQ